MTDTVRDLIQGWEGQAVVTRYDAPSASWFFIAIHNTTLGPAVGGCRIRKYPTPEAGLLDAMRLAAGMTYKWAGVDVPFGGGKAVIAVPRQVEGSVRGELLVRFAGLLESLRGSFATGVDLGTTPADIREMAKHTSYVMGQTKDGRSIDPGPYTALGVFTGIRATVRNLFDGNDTLSGRRILIQGVGDVGWPLAGMLKSERARLLFADTDTSRAAAAVKEFNGELVDPESVYTTECDVYVPCAVGATLNRDTIPVLRCRSVAGSANNQLATDEDAVRLHKRGILYAPDYIINAGGAISFAMIHDGTEDKDSLNARVRRIGDALDDIFEHAARYDETPAKAARARAERALRRDARDTTQSAA